MLVSIIHISNRSIATIAGILEIRYAKNLYTIGRMRVVNVDMIRSATRMTAEIYIHITVMLYRDG